jgi:hypothetical protein
MQQETVRTAPGAERKRADKALISAKVKFFGELVRLNPSFSEALPQTAEGATAFAVEVSLFQ